MVHQRMRASCCIMLILGLSLLPGQERVQTAHAFERQRFEPRPEQQVPYDAKQGRLDAELLAAQDTVITYYSAINRQSYAEAYQQWANDGAASNQTFEQFKQGFANTVQVSLLLDTPIFQRAGMVRVPVTILAVVNGAGRAQEQRVQQFRGSYTVQRTPTNEWKLGAAQIAEVPHPTLPLPDLSTPTRTIQAYYDAINRRAFARAYTYWANLGLASNQSLAELQQGFATTNHVTIRLGTPETEGAAGSIYATVPIVIVAAQHNHTQQTFCGSYTLRRLNLPPFDQLGWRIERARIVHVPRVQSTDDQLQHLLSNCPS